MGQFTVYEKDFKSVVNTYNKVYNINIIYNNFISNKKIYLHTDENIKSNKLQYKI